MDLYLENRIWGWFTVFDTLTLSQQINIIYLAQDIDLTKCALFPVVLKSK